MPVEAVTFRLPPRDMCRPEDGTFQTHYEARVDRPLASLDLNEVFQDVGLERLSPGDKVTFCAFEGSHISDDRRLREVGTCRIVAKVKENGRAKIKAVWAGEIFKVPEAAQVAPKETKLKLEVRGEFEGDYTVRDEKGTVLERLDTKEAAEAFVAGYTPGVKKGPGRPPRDKAAYVTPPKEATV